MTTPLHLEILCRVYNRGVANAVDAAESHAVDELRNVGLIEPAEGMWRLTEHGRAVLLLLENSFARFVY